MNEYLERADEQQDEEQLKTGSKSPQSAIPSKKTLETNGPVKDKDYKVLHKDGSLATDLPDKEGEGSGALEGTVGLGT